MAQGLQVNARVYVPCSRVSGLESVGVALFRTKVLEVGHKRVKVALRNGDPSEWIGASLVHRDVGILILNIGDFETELTLLDPLAKSVAQFCRLLVPDDQIRSLRVRSVIELQTVWRKEQAVYSHVVWIGHGKEDGVRFAVNGWVGAQSLVDAIRVHGATKKTYISLCCQTGYKSFGSVVSKSATCRNFLGPFHSVEGAIASQFCQTFLATHLLEGKTVGAAFRAARSLVPGSSSFRLWNSGKLKAGPK